VDQNPDPVPALSSYGPRGVTQHAWRAFVNLMQQLGARRAEWPFELNLIRQWYEPHLERLHDDAHVRMADLVQLEQIAAGYPSRERFLTELTLDPPDATSNQAGVPMLDEDYLILSTIHSAKGQEWNAVFILNAVDGCIPSDMSTGSNEGIEEERRLLYVAMTRAEDQLALLVPQRFYVHQQSAKGDRHLYAARTRFIPQEILPHFELIAWPTAEQDTSPLRGPAGVRVDIGARMRAKWA
jgi:DNA helicase-2/ATP-dependent DNA helicase PcrA